METTYPVILVASPSNISEQALEKLTKLLKLNPHMSVCMSARKILVNSGRHIKIPKEYDTDELLSELGFKGKKVKTTDKYVLVELASDEKFELMKMATVLRHIEIDDMFRDEKEDKGDVVLDALKPEPKKTKKTKQTKESNKKEKTKAKPKQTKRKSVSQTSKKTTKKSKKGAKK